MWGLVPAAGRGSRIQPLAFSKELLPVGSRADQAGERPCAVAEHLIERMIQAGADKICFVIAPGKSDIMEYFGGGYGGATTAYVVQPQATGLCDALFRAAAVIDPSEPVLIGLPDTIWFPRDGYRRLPEDQMSFLLFPVDRPECFDSVLLDSESRVLEIQVKQPGDPQRWIWGAIRLPGAVFHDLHHLWRRRERADEYLGTLVNAYLAEGGQAVGVKAGSAYVDVGTLDGYKQAVQLLSDESTVRGTQEDVRLGLAWPFGRARAAAGVL